MRTKQTKQTNIKSKKILKKEEPKEDSPKKTKLLTGATRKKLLAHNIEPGLKKLLKSKDKKIPEELPKEYDKNLYTLDMCMECKKKCKMKAITGATMITCPDTTVDIKTWRQEHPRKYAIIYLGN